MGYEYEDDSSSQAFNRLFNTIKDLQNIENSIKSRNISALEKCKNEIEYLLSVAASDTEKGRMPRPRKVS